MSNPEQALDVALAEAREQGRTEGRLEGLEEAARVCDLLADHADAISEPDFRCAANRIRALKSQEASNG